MLRSWREHNNLTNITLAYSTGNPISNSSLEEKIYHLFDLDKSLNCPLVALAKWTVCNFVIVITIVLTCSLDYVYIVGSRGASQLGGIF